jgi:predicted secreted hydrolase
MKTRPFEGVILSTAKDLGSSFVAPLILRKRTALISLLLFAFCIPASTQQYTQALPGYHYSFPHDHFNHPAYQTEWWYYTGNLRAQDGHRFGFELTFFRQATARDTNTSPWAIHDIYMAHLALSDITGKRYYATERLNRQGPGIAGVDEATDTVWNGNWQTTIKPNAHTLQGIADNFSFTLQAKPTKPTTIHGTDGVSQKSEGAGHASHYISFTRMSTAGTIILAGKPYTVEGDTWMDHEFFSDSLGGEEVGWDWLSIQLADNTELMLYRLRHKDGSVDPYSSGTYIDAAGKATHLTLADFTMTATGPIWKSDHTAATYPIAWQLAIPKLNLQLSVTTPLAAQEFRSRYGPSYWEGAIDITGQHNGQPIQGTGYLEMTGYANQGKPLFSK